MNAGPSLHPSSVILLPCPAAAALPVAWLFSSEKQSTQDNGQRAKFKSPITDVNGNSGTVSLGFTARIISQSLDAAKKGTGPLNARVLSPFLQRRIGGLLMDRAGLHTIRSSFPRPP